MKVNKKMKKIRIITLLFLFLAVITFAILYNGAISKPLKSNEKTVSVKVKAGDGFYDVLNRLDDEGKLHNKLLIKVKLSIDKQNITLKEGTYEINSDVTLEQLIKDLQDDSYNINMIKVTIPEGYSVEEIAELMEEKGLCSKNEFIEAIKNYELPTFVEVNEKRRYNLEGFLYPDTYLIEMGTNANNIIDKMLERFNENTDVSLLELLREASYYYNEFREENSYFINNEIDNYEEVLNDIKKEDIKEYAVISKEELLSMNEENWVYNSKAGKSFYKEFTSMFSVDKDMTIAMMDDLALDVQELEPSEAVDKMIELINIDNEEVRFVASKMMNKFVNKIRLWKLKGTSTNDAKANVISEVSSKVVGRNDPCTCGSGKKYKKCCGRNGNVVVLPIK